MFGVIRYIKHEQITLPRSPTVQTLGLSGLERLYTKNFFSPSTSLRSWTKLPGLVRYSLALFQTADNTDSVICKLALVYETDTCPGVVADSFGTCLAPRSRFLILDTCLRQDSTVMLACIHHLPLLQYKSTHL